MVGGRVELSSQASQVWDAFWELPDEERDILLARLIEASSVTLVVGGDACREKLRVFHRNNVTGILGDVVGDRCNHQCFDSPDEDN